MLTLTYGFKKPQTGDRGSVFYPALEGNFQQLNDHTHNGVNSAKLDTAATVVQTTAISSASWGADLGGGNYRQAITLPASLSYDNIMINVKGTDGHIYYLTIEKISATQFYVYTNDNTKSYVAVYTS